MTDHLAGKWEKGAIKTEAGMGCNTMGTLALIGIPVLERVGILKVFGGPSHPITLKPKPMEKGEKMGLMEIAQDKWGIARDLWLELEHESYNTVSWTCENIMGQLKSLDRSVDTEERDTEIALKPAWVQKGCASSNIGRIISKAWLHQAGNIQNRQQRDQAIAGIPYNKGRSGQFRAYTDVQQDGDNPGT